MGMKFQNTFCYKIIYIMTIADKKHEGLLKIGDATLHTKKSIDQLPPNSHELNQAAHDRIKSYTNTAGISYKLLYTELAIKRIIKNGDEIYVSFRDHNIHDILENSRIIHKKIDDTTGREWFPVDLETAKEAISAYKNNYANLSHTSQTEVMPIIFRPEQKDAIDRTVTQFSKGNRMLWNAKMRFGKTLCALEVIKRCEFKKTIILTHRPVVNDGWYEDFTKIFHGTGYAYSSKTNGNTVEELLRKGNPFVYFASIQDLRGSSVVGGKFAKNKAIFDTTWDCVIVDEAHEGTTTPLGDETIKTIYKEDQGKTKFLALSGTPFNIMDDYDDKAIYTWDYIMEQEAKQDWDLCHFGDSNPYDELPSLQIFTYNLGELLNNERFNTYEDSAFNFSEFFRTWTGDIRYDFDPMPVSAKVGDFVHENDIMSFLNLMTAQSDNSYPYSKEEYRSYFKHSLWIVPGIKAAKALKELMYTHPVFGSGQFNVVNVAGSDDEESANALDSVKTAIAEADKRNEYTITLSCGKLCTGVTIKEWTAVFMLAGSYSTSASNYLQTIFRVQSPCNKNGMIKETAYVFDFAPDRTLKMVSEAVSVSAKAGKNKSGDKAILGKFLNYCPVISISGSKMTEYKPERLLQQLKRAYADKVARNGFADPKLYNEELMKLDDLDIKKFEDLQKIMKASKSDYKPKDIKINDQGFDNDEHEKPENDKNKKKRKLTEEEKKAKAEHAKKLKEKAAAISILTGISVRMPLLIYGSDVPYSEEITLDKFVEQIDDASWKEFMPVGVTKKLFGNFKKYYDEDIFIAAGRRIRNIAREADTLAPRARIIKIAELFATFKNPDKETILTPWRVVNLHMSNTLGGYDFYDENHEKLVEEPRFVHRGDVTRKVFLQDGVQILEINSKTGLYPLYVAYSVYRAKCDKYKPEELTINLQQSLWKEVLQENVFVICKTPMAKYITQRTLAGYTDVKINAHFFDDLINQIENKSSTFIDKVLRSSFWKMKGGKMKFQAVVGNPPYQEVTAKNQSSTNGQATSRSIFQYFQQAADQLTNGVTSLIYPGARWIHQSGKGMNQFGKAQINDPSLERLDFYPNSQDIFEDVAIGDGISIVLKNKNKHTPGFLYVYHNDEMVKAIEMDNPGDNLMVLNPFDSNIVSKVDNMVQSRHVEYLHDKILPRSLFGIESDFVENNPELVREYEEGDIIDYNEEVKIFTNDRAGKAGRAKWFVTDIDNIPSNKDYIKEWQVVVSSANAGGQKRDNQIEILDNHSAFGRSRVALNSFKTQQEAENFFKYANTYLIKFMFLMTDESLTSLAKRVPDLLDYTNENKIINFNDDLNDQLFKLVGLDETEIAYVKSTVDNIRNKEA